MTSAVTYNTDELSERAGISTWSLYESVKRGDCPFTFIKVGKRIVFPKAPADKILGIESSLGEGGET